MQDPPAHAEVPPAAARTLAEIEDRLVTGRLDIPLLHGVAFEVLSMSTSGETDAQELASLIHRDQAIATHVLRIANSAAYMPREPIASLQQAISRLGLTNLRQIVIAVSTRTRLFSFGAFDAHARVLWRHAFATGLYAREVARKARLDGEAAFMAGLLHDIGKPIVLRVIGDLGPSAADILGATVLREILEEHHLSIGKRLADSWRLPELVSQAIAFHHDVEASQGLVTAVALADALSEDVGSDFAPESRGTLDPLDHPVLPSLGLTPSDVATILERRGAIEALVLASEG